MGEAALDSFTKSLTIFSHIITYGNEANTSITNSICEEIETMWNEPAGIISIQKEIYQVRFCITGEVKPDITPTDIYQDTNSRNNFFRIEQFALGNISFVDGIGCNSGYFILENLYKGSTTAAHEYGHSLGLHHPVEMDIRGKGIPSIMYPRGTLVDAQFQYEPAVPAGQKGGTMHPAYRRVMQSDIINLNLQRLPFKNTKAVVGEFTNIWHQDHATLKTSSS